MRRVAKHEQNTHLVLGLPLIALLLQPLDVSFVLLSLDVYLSQPALGKGHAISDQRMPGWYKRSVSRSTDTYCSVTVLRFFSDASISSSSSATLRERPSDVVFVASASLTEPLVSVSCASAFSSSVSLSESWCLSELVSCSLWSSSCSCSLTFFSAISARSTAASASARRLARRYAERAGK